jgi:hypothetical protein
LRIKYDGLVEELAELNIHLVRTRIPSSHKSILLPRSAPDNQDGIKSERDDAIARLSAAREANAGSLKSSQTENSEVDSLRSELYVTVFLFVSWTNCWILS